MEPHRAGTVALIGRPNVGKSTLLNTVVGQKVAIVSDKAQTTRRRMLGIASHPGYQIVFVDTPGIHEPHTQLGKLLNESAQQALADVDVVLAVVDASKMPGREDQGIAKLLDAGGWLAGADGSPAPKGDRLVVCLNKMDLLKAPDVKGHVEAYQALFRTENTMLTSLVRKSGNVELLVAMLVERLPEGPALYDEDEVTDMPMRVLAAELIREKVLRLTRQEVPHAVATVVDSWEEEGDLTRIHASIVVEKDGQKAIVIGKHGAMLRQVGTEARQEIESWLGRRVHLQLFVKVRSDWRQNPRMLRDLEYMG